MTDHLIPPPAAEHPPSTVTRPDAPPMCEECDLPMHPFAADGYEGWGCDGCGWSFDTSVPEGQKAW